MRIRSSSRSLATSEPNPNAGSWLNPLRPPSGTLPFCVALLLSAIVPTTRAATTPVVVERLHSFGFTNLTGALPLDSVIEGIDGALYGTTRQGGVSDLGTIFRVNKDGTGYTVLLMFTPEDAVPGTGVRPSAALLEGSDGALYGTTTAGGSDTAFGSVFKIQKDGSGYTTLWRFRDTLQVALQLPHYSALMEGSDGALYGTSAGGGSAFSGMIYRLNKNGSGFAVLRSFGLTPDDGRVPIGALLEGADGALYGITAGGGGPHFETFFRGTLYKLNKDGSGYTVVHSFGQVAGDGAMSLQDSSLGIEAGGTRLVRGSDGAIYGAARIGGCLSCSGVGLGYGTVFKLNGDGSGYTTVMVFTNGPAEVNRPNGSLMEGSDGFLYGTSSTGGANGWGGVFKLYKNGDSYTVLQSLSLKGLGPQSPVFELVQGSDGKIYGTSAGGGSTNLGTVFRLNPDGRDFSMVWNFDRTGGDGWDPRALMEGSDGLLYGTTSQGGRADAGTLFRLHSDGSGYTILRSFGTSVWDGIHPESALLEASDGMLYGTTPNGGVNGYSGTIFKLNRDGTGYTVLRDFGLDSHLNGEIPAGALIELSDGALYGATVSGGRPSGTVGTVFKLNKDGSGYTVLRSFASNTGLAPQGSLLEGSDGALYGTTHWGAGTVFRMNKDGTGYAVLRSFGLTAGDAQLPNGGLVEGSNGALYGTTKYGGSTNRGTVFRVNKDGTGYAIVRSFTGTDGDAAYPSALVRGDGSSLYGTTPGTIFRLNEDGTSFEVLWSFEGGDVIGVGAAASLLKGSSGKFFGLTSGGSDGGFGGVFALHFTSLRPTVIGMPARSVSTGGAYLLGTVTPNGADTTAWFEYGPTLAYGSTTPRVAVGNGSRAVLLDAIVSDLQPGTEYHFRLAATNDVGAAFGTDMVFQTLFDVPRPRIRQFERLASGEFRLRFDGVIGASYSVEASSELTDDPFLWQSLGAAVAVAPGRFEFTDNEATQFPTRFYRLTSP